MLFILHLLSLLFVYSKLYYFCQDFRGILRLSKVNRVIIQDYEVESKSVVRFSENLCQGFLAGTAVTPFVP